MKITMDEWESALRDALAENQPRRDGASTTEIAAAWGCGKDVALRRLRTLISAGKVRFVGHEPRLDLTGRKQLVPVYEVVRNVGRKK